MECVITTIACVMKTSNKCKRFKDVRVSAWVFCLQGDLVRPRAIDRLNLPFGADDGARFSAR